MSPFAKGVFKLTLLIFELHIHLGIAEMDYSAVTRLSDKNYRDLKRLRSWKFLEEESPEDKKEICDSILSSPFFSDECPLDMSDPRVLQNFSDLYLYELDDPYVRKYYPQFFQYKNSSSNPYKLVNVSTSEDVKREFVFSCIAWNNISKSAVEYLITQEYNWDWHWQSRVRAVFKYDETKDLVMVAMGEQPTQLSTDFDEFGEDEYKVDLRDQDIEMCNTNATQRTRLCSHMMNAEMFRGKIQYTPYKEESQCKRRELLLERGAAKFIFNKYVIECKVLDLEERQAAEYDISIGLESQHFYISKPIDGGRNLICAHCHQPWPFD